MAGSGRFRMSSTCPSCGEPITHECGGRADPPDRAVQPDTPTMDQDARNALADATWLDRDGVNIEDAVKRLHRLGYTVVRAAAMTKEATR
jgi:hypothetical protein